MNRNNLKSYQTFEDKSPFFSLNKKIESKEDFDQLWNLLLAFQKSRFHIFRGVKQAKYKLYNSSQRYYISKNLENRGVTYTEFILNNIKLAQSWNNGTIEKYFSQRGIGENCVAYLSIMQHYQLPTPLLDCTINPFVALFFSTEQIESPISIGGIESYSSLYFVYSKYYLMQGFQDLFQSLIKKNNDGVIKYNDIHLIPFLLFFDQLDKFQIINNQNIINQEGLFFYACHSIIPIEEHFKLIIDLHKAKGTIPKESRSEFLGCWNINKSLNSYIRSRLGDEMGITEKFLFPDFKDLKKEFDLSFEIG